MPGLRTGAPGKYFGKSTGQYRLVDEKVRYFVAPPVEDLNSSPVRSSLFSPKSFVFVDRCLS